MKKLASKILGVTSKNYISALVCYNGVDNRLLKIVKEMASKERKLKEFKRRLHLKGELLEKALTDKKNIKLRIQEKDGTATLIVLKSHKESYALASVLNAGEYVSATGIPKFRYILCTRIKRMKRPESGTQSRLESFA